MFEERQQISLENLRPRASSTLQRRSAHREAARRKGIGNHSALLRWWYRSVAAEVWRRASRMVLACLPREPRQTEYMVDGEMETGFVLEEDGAAAGNISEDELESNLGDYAKSRQRAWSDSACRVIHLAATLKTKTFRRTLMHRAIS